MIKHQITTLKTFRHLKHTIIYCSFHTGTVIALFVWSCSSFISIPASVAHSHKPHYPALSRLPCLPSLMLWSYWFAHDQFFSRWGRSWIVIMNEITQCFIQLTILSVLQDFENMVKDLCNGAVKSYCIYLAQIVVIFE